MQSIKLAALPQSQIPVSTVEVITPQQARHLRDTAHFERQRNISRQNVARLAGEMSAGRFTPGTQVYLAMLPDGSQRILNGNHTLEAVVAAGLPQILTITRKPVTDIDEAGRIYAVFDIQKLRTWTDSLRATGAGEDFPLAKQVLSALGIIETRFAQSGYTTAGHRLDRIGKMEEYRDAAVLLSNAIHGAPKNSSSLVKRAAIMAVALETFRYQPSMAFEFWGRVAQDDGLLANMPERALLHWLRNNTTAGGQIGQRDHARAAALAWNAAFKGEPRAFVKPNAMVSFFLLGTPYANGLEG